MHEAMAAMPKVVAVNAFCKQSLVTIECVETLPVIVFSRIQSLTLDPTCHAPMWLLLKKQDV